MYSKAFWENCLVQDPKMTCLKVGNRRIHRRLLRRGNSKYWKVTQDELRMRTQQSDNFTLFWLAFQTWVRIHHWSLEDYGVARLQIRARFMMSPDSDSRGHLYYVVLEFIADDTVPGWFPRFEDAPERSRNVLHMSICFTGDLEWLEEEDRRYADQYLAELQEDPLWNGTNVREAYVNRCPRRGGTFHLGGFYDYRLQWLHSIGSYKDRPFGHIALYIGGLYR